MFGNITNTTQDMFMAKTYFNGYSCNHNLLSVGNSLPNGANFTDFYVSNNALLLNAIQLDHLTINYYNDKRMDFFRTQMCSASSVLGGSNAFVVPKDNGNKSLFYPNPFNPNVSNNAQINLESGNRREVKISIYDMLGRILYLNNVFIDMNKSSLEIDFENINPTPGIYLVKINDNGKYSSTTIQIK